ncbi:MAG: type II glyceraldehyde-3-phosphate dehydrogenase [Candidatus Methanomethyliaceae archaeon]|nr:type II glyceraldehyde-3-phosphate dehydrogenase [Candidatus Methanomethyliaceae archaeon]MDW7970804.1 type II glyceraldehyde-3-phosphate dehydrogenase [Nitrososphaerota archaeon]
MKLRIGINGYGTIGKRVADAVLKQKDMELIGVTKTKPNFECRIAMENGIDIYASSSDRIKLFEEAGIKVKGSLEDLLKQVDVIIDCTPGGVGASYKPIYEKYGIKAIFQGGEKHDVAGFSFNSYSNYREALGRNFIRVVSCNTTGLCRLLYVMDNAFGIKKARVVLIRRGADPHEDSKGPINSIVTDPVTIPSHHGPDVNKVLKHINITTIAFAVPETLMHVHVLNLELNNTASESEIIKALSNYSRIKILSAKDGIASTSAIIEYARDLGRKRYDIHELIVWKESIKSFGNEVYLSQAVHQEAIVVPENIDAIRAITKTIEDPEISIKTTDESLGIGRW